jgi:hypothetical protein
MTDLEKEVYNKWLAVTSIAINRPFRLRENWVNFDCREEYPFLQRMTQLFQKHPHIRWDDFFVAPYRVRKEGNRISLAFYVTPRAMKDYSTYMKKIMLMDPDESQQTEAILQSYRFIKDFCIEHKLKANEYTQFSQGYVPAFIKHVKQHQVSIYAMFAFPKAFSMMNNLPPEEFSLFIGDVNLYTMKTKYDRSDIRAKNVALYQALEKYINKTLETTTQIN